MIVYWYLANSKIESCSLAIFKIANSYLANCSIRNSYLANCTMGNCYLAYCMIVCCYLANCAIESYYCNWKLLSSKLHQTYCHLRKLESSYRAIWKIANWCCKALICKLHIRKWLSCLSFKLHDKKKPLSGKLHGRNLLSCILHDRKLLSCKFHDRILLSCKFHNAKFLRLGKRWEFTSQVLLIFKK